jgi:hypothetical protein
MMGEIASGKDRRVLWGLLAAAPLLVIMVMAACTRVPSLSEAEAVRLHAAAVLILNADDRPLNVDNALEDIQEFHPRSIRVTSRGLYVSMKQWGFYHEAGYFVPMHPKSFAPPAGGDLEFQQLRANVYEFHSRNSISGPY